MKKKQSSQPIKNLEKKVKVLHAEQKEQVSTLQKQIKKGHRGLRQQIKKIHKEVVEGKTILAPTPTPHLSFENQMLIESMNKLAAVVKQLLVLFNQKLAKEEGPLFAKLNEIIEQNEKIAEGMLVVADMVKENQTPTAPVREVNPYLPRLGPMPEPLRVQRPGPGEMQPALPSDFGRFQQTSAEEEPLFMGSESTPLQPIPEHSAPLPPFSPAPQGEQLPSRKRMLF